MTNIKQTSEQTDTFHKVSSNYFCPNKNVAH